MGRDGIFDKISVRMKIRKMSQTCNTAAGSENIQNCQQRPKIAEMGSWTIFDETLIGLKKYKNQCGMNFICDLRVKMSHAPILPRPRHFSV